MHTWSDEEIELLNDTSKSVREVAGMLDLREGTVRNKRYALNIKGNQSLVMSKPRPNMIKNETRICIGKGCNSSFTVKPAMTKKYCSHSCQQRTNNVAAKGQGSRKIRNPNIKAYTKYARMVHTLTAKVYNINKSIINPDNHPRTLCGVEGGWQLDHIITIKECFEKGASINEAASLENLRMLPWRENLMRNFN